MENQELTQEQKDQIILVKISKSTSQEIFSFMRKLWKDGKRKGNKYFEWCYQEAIKRVPERPTMWERAKDELDKLELPYGLYKSQDLMPIYGYVCRLNIGEKSKNVAIYNEEKRIAYVKQFDINNDYKTAKKILTGK